MKQHKTYFKRQGNKFGSVRQTYNGRSYHSKKEAQYAAELDWLKKAGQIKSIEPQYKISLDVNGIHIANYFMDFKVTLPDDRIEMHEVKGAETDRWRMKWRLARALYPEWKFILIK